MAEENIFADGFFFKRNEKAPDWVIGSLSVKAEEAIAFIKKHKNDKGYVNLAIKTGRAGNHYVSLDTFQPKGKKQEEAPAQQEEGEDGPLPF
jgi:hypothetical protein